jgi:hypothetical protein
MIGAEASNNHCSFLEIGQTRILTAISWGEEFNFQ